MQEQENLLTICPCGKSNNCYNSKAINFSQCFDCGLTKLPEGTETETYPKLYKDFSIGNWFPYYLNTKDFTVFLDGTSKEDAKYVYIEFDENKKPIQSTKKEFERNNFYELLKFLNDETI